MMRILTTDEYVNGLLEIQAFIYDQTNSLAEVKKFHSEHDRVKEFIKQNPGTPAPHPSTGTQSWPFGNGRYRLFFKVVKNTETIIHLLDVIDNRMLNKGVYPNNSMPTYEVDD